MKAFATVFAMRLSIEILFVKKIFAISKLCAVAEI